MEIGIVIAIAIGFLFLGCALGWRAGEHHGVQTTTATLSTHIRGLEAQANRKLADVKHEKHNAEAQMGDLEKTISSLKFEVEKIARQKSKSDGQLAQERERFNILMTPARSVAQEQSRNAIVKLQAAVAGLHKSGSVEKIETEKQ